MPRGYDLSQSKLWTRDLDLRDAFVRIARLERRVNALCAAVETLYREHSRGGTLTGSEIQNALRELDVAQQR